MTPPADRRLRKRKGLGHDHHEMLGRSRGLIGRLVGKRPASANWPAAIGRGIPAISPISGATKETETRLGFVMEGVGQPEPLLVCKLQEESL